MAITFGLFYTDILIQNVIVTARNNFACFLTKWANPGIFMLISLFLDSNSSDRFLFLGFEPERRPLTIPLSYGSRSNFACNFQTTLKVIPLNRQVGR